MWQTGQTEYFPENIYTDEKDPGSWRESWVFKLPGGEIAAIYNDITERKQVEAYQEMGRQVLQILNEPGDLQDCIQRVLAELKTRTGFDAVGIRLQDGDDFPYLAQDGFSTDFLLTENTLTERGADGGLCRNKDGSVSLECTCGLVISGKTDPANPLFTQGGSSWTNDSFPFLDVPADEDPRFHPRNECIHQGYASVALVPIRNKNGIVGLIQFNDRRKGRFSHDAIEQFESIAAHIGEALIRKVNEKALARSEEKFRLLIENSHDIIYTLTPEGVFTFVSPAWTVLLGHPVNQVAGHAFQPFVHPDDLAGCMSWLQKVVETGQRQEGVEYRVRHVDGSWRWHTSGAVPLRDTTGTVIGFEGIARDISERKQAEVALQKSEERLREVLENSIDAAYKRNLQTDTYDYLSPSFARISGYAPSEMNALPLETVENLMHPDDEAEVQRVVADSVTNPDNRPYQMEYRFKHKQGHYRWFQDRYTVMRDERGQPLALIGSVSDITERKQAEDEVAKSQERVTSVLDSLDSLVYVADLNSYEVLFVNRYGRDIWGDILGRKCWDSIQKDQQGPCSFCTNNRLVSDNGIPTGVYRWEFQNTVNGRWYECRDQAIPWIGREIVRMEIATDITERKLNEEALALSEEKYRTILENMQDSYIEVDLVGNFTFINEATCHNLGYTMDELIGQNFSKIAPGKDEVKAIFQAYGDVYKTGEPNKGFAFKVMRKDGSIGYAETSISLIKNAQGRPVGFRSVGRDVTERKQMEQKLIELATHDGLTGIPNRALLYDRFDIAMANAQRNMKKIAIMTLDLDRFKIVNDTLGHDVGDKLLAAAADRLIAALRKSDTVARLGGDEFAMLLWEVGHNNDAVIIAEKILEDFRQPFIIDRHSLKVTVSIGIAIYPEDGENMEELLKCSDKMLYSAKQNGRDRFAI